MPPFRHPLTATRRHRRGFTLVELVVVVVLLALLAALAVVTYRTNINQAHDAVAKQELAALNRATWASTRAAVAAGDSNVARGSYDQTLIHGHYRQSTVAATQQSIWAAATDRDNQMAVIEDPGLPSYRHGQISWGMNADATKLGLAMVSRSGKCAFFAGTSGDPDALFVRSVDVEAGQCVADPEIAGPLDDPDGTGGEDDPDGSGDDETVDEETDPFVLTVDVPADSTPYALDLSFNVPLTGTGNSYTLTCDPVGEAPAKTLTIDAETVDVTGHSERFPGLEGGVLHDCVVDSGTRTSTQDDGTPLAPATDDCQVPVGWLDCLTPPEEEPPTNVPDDDTPENVLPPGSGIWGVSSLPSTHASYPHHFYVTTTGTGAGDGALWYVTETASGVSHGFQVLRGIDEARDVVVGPNPTTGVIDTLYLLESGTGTLWRMPAAPLVNAAQHPSWQPRTPAAEGIRVVTGLGSDTAGLTVGTCFNSSGDVCAYIGSETGTHRVNVSAAAPRSATTLAGFAAEGVAFAADGDGLLVSRGTDGALVRVRSNGTTAVQNAGADARGGLATTPVAGRWVADTETARVGVLDAGVTWSTAPLHGPHQLHDHYNAPWLYVGDTTALRKVDTGNGQVIRVWPTQQVLLDPPLRLSRVEQTGNRRVTVSWLQDRAVDEVFVHRRSFAGGSYGAWQTSGPLNPADGSATFPGLDPEGTYEFAVAPTAATSGRNVSNSIRFQLTPDTELTLTEVRGESASSVRLSWTLPGDYVSARGQYRAAGDGAWINAGAFGLDTSQTITGLDPGTAYDFRIEGQVAGGGTVTSPSQRFTPTADDARLLAVGTPAARRLRMEWTRPAGYQGATFNYRIAGSGAAPSTISLGSSTYNWATNATLTPGATYEVWVTIRRSGQPAQDTRTALVTIPAETPRLIAAGSHDWRRLTMAWDRPTGYEGATFNYRIAGSGAAPSTTTLGGSSTYNWATAQTLIPGETYEAWVTIRRSNAPEADTNHALVTIPKETPQLLSVEQTAPRQMTFSWNKPTGYSGVQAYWRLAGSGDAPTMVNIGTFAATWSTPATLIPGATYEFWMVINRSNMPDVQTPVVRETVAPDRPRIISLTQPAPQQVRIEWYRPAGYQGADVKYRIAGSGAAPSTTTFGSSSYDWATPASLTPGETYEFWVTVRRSAMDPVDTGRRLITIE